MYVGFPLKYSAFSFMQQPPEKRQHFGNKTLIWYKRKNSSSDQWNCTYDFPCQSLGKTHTSLYGQSFFGTGAHIWLSLICLQVQIHPSTCISKGNWTGAQVQGNATPPDPSRADTALWQSPSGDFNFVYSCFEIKLAHSLLKTEKNNALELAVPNAGLSHSQRNLSYVHGFT